MRIASRGPLLCLLLAGAAAAPAAPAAETTAGCAPAADLQFICGVQSPEDLARIPGTSWLIASGFTPGSGLRFVDTHARTARPAYTGAPGESRPDPRRPLRSAQAPDFMPDNLHWDGSTLLVAGMVHDEPACGGPRGVINGEADPMVCHRGNVVARLDPVRMTYEIVYRGPPNAAFNGLSTGTLVDGVLWMGSWQADRLAYRLPPGTGR